MTMSRAPLLRMGALALAFFVILLAAAPAEVIGHRTDWMQEKGWGISAHYLGPKEWSEVQWTNHLKTFQVEKLADQVAKTGAGWFVMSTGQNYNKYCIHNTILKKFAGAAVHMPPPEPVDLVDKLYDALNKRGVKLMLYITSNPPEQHPEIGKAMGYEGGPIGKRNKDFMGNWEKAMGEWARRYKTKVAGFWVDGIYDEPNYKAGYKDGGASLDSFAKELRSGNPDAVLSFNDGKRADSLTINNDLMSGEIYKAEEKLPECPGRWFEKTSSRGLKYKIQWGLHTFLSCMWGGNGCNPKVPRQFPTEIPGGNLAYQKRVLAKGGVITWDVPIHMHDGPDKNGMLLEAFMPELIKFKDSKGGGFKSKLAMEPWQSMEYETEEDYEDEPMRHIQRSGRILWTYGDYEGPSKRSVLALAAKDELYDNEEEEDADLAEDDDDYFEMGSTGRSLAYGGKPLAAGKDGLNPADFARVLPSQASADSADIDYGKTAKFLGGEVFAPNQRALAATWEEDDQSYDVYEEASNYEDEF